LATLGGLLFVVAVLSAPLGDVGPDRPDVDSLRTSARAKTYGFTLSDAAQDELDEQLRNNEEEIQKGTELAVQRHRLPAAGLR
jgi:hypothetical protein